MLPHRPSARPYLKAGSSLDRDAVRNVARLRLTSHKLKVQTGREQGIPYEDRVCSRCGMDKVDDEAHLLLECEAMAPYRALSAVDEMLEKAGDSLHSLFAYEDATLMAQYVSMCMSLADEMADASLAASQARQGS